MIWHFLENRKNVVQNSYFFKMEKKGFILVGLTNSGKSSMLNEMSG